MDVDACACEQRKAHNNMYVKWKRKKIRNKTTQFRKRVAMATIISNTL